MLLQKALRGLSGTTHFSPIHIHCSPDEAEHAFPVCEKKKGLAVFQNLFPNKDNITTISYKPQYTLQHCYYWYELL